jgi:tripartite-type tricarboxylate transporter receptor subunit TctC
MQKILAAATAATLFAGIAHAAESWPNRPIKVISTFSPGGQADTLARIVNEKAQVALGQPVILDYRPGAGGNIAGDLVAKATDDHTILFGTPALAINPSLYKSMTYEPLKDLVPITLAASGPYVIYVSGKLPVNNIADLIKLAKEKPGALNYASVGVGSGTHLAAVLFTEAAGINVQHVPYKGMAQILPDLVQNQVQFTFNAIGPAAQFMATGEVKLIATSLGKRIPQYPEIPAIAEVLPGFSALGWYGYQAPASLPKEAQEKLNKALTEAIAAPEISDRILKLGLIPDPQSLPEAMAFLKSETVKWSAAVKASGATVE